jgi:hypothetical protein
MKRGVKRSWREARRIALCASLVMLVLNASPVPVLAYSFGYIVGDMRQPAAISGGTACPEPTRFNLAAGPIERQWSTSLGTSPVTILTQATTLSGIVSEIQGVINESLAVWTGIAGTSLVPASLAPLGQTSVQDACDSTDGLNTICLNQSDPGFTTGVLAFTRVVSVDTIGEVVGTNAPSTFVGEIEDADTYVRPGDASTVFATPLALAANPQAYDLESVLIHELGHSFGLEHSGVWRAIMQPTGAGPGQFVGERPTVTEPDAPLADDDRAAIRMLYPDPTNTTFVGTISGQVLPVNPLSLAGQPGTTGIFAAQVVAVDATTGTVAAAARAGWSCTGTGPAVFDGSYVIAALPANSTQAYILYVEPFTSAEDASDVAQTLAAVCRNAATDPGWPAVYACTVPTASTSFMARIRP